MPASKQHRQYDGVVAAAKSASRPAPDKAAAQPAKVRPTEALQRAIAGAPGALTAADVLALQRTVGNRAVHQLLWAAPPAGQARPNPAGLPDHLKAGVESLSGLAMDDVHVHYNSAMPAAVQAHAFARGTQIHLAPGQEQHLPHEAWHVVQQKQGRVKPTLQAKGVAINDDTALEREADVMGSEASAMSGPAVPIQLADGEKSDLGWQLSAASAIVIQRTKLGIGTLSSAREYLKWHISKHPKDSKESKEQGAIKRSIYRQIGADADSKEETEGRLKQAGIIDQQDVDDINRNADSFINSGGQALARERKLLPSHTWMHIWRGDFNNQKHRPTGYHWKGEKEKSWLVGTKEYGKETKEGFYEERVQVRDAKIDDICAKAQDTKGNVAGKKKENMSTFFPDDWGEADVKDAIELRDSQGSITTADAKGVALVKTGDTIYPELE